MSLIEGSSESGDICVICNQTLEEHNEAKVEKCLDLLKRRLALKKE